MRTPKEHRKGSSEGCVGAIVCLLEQPAFTEAAQIEVSLPLCSKIHREEDSLSGQPFQQTHN